MIILRKPHKQGNIVFNGELLGLKNGSNKIFNLEKKYRSNLLYVTYNGQVLYPHDDFIELTNTSIEFIYIAPYPDDVLKAHYEQG